MPRHHRLLQRREISQLAGTVIQPRGLCGIDIDFADQSLFLFASRAHEPAEHICPDPQNQTHCCGVQRGARVYCYAPQG
jgi:hypothetical protein